jgi:hypothetical protein
MSFRLWVSCVTAFPALVSNSIHHLHQVPCLPIVDQLQSSQHGNTPINVSHSNNIQGRVRTRTVKKASRVMIEKVLPPVNQIYFTNRPSSTPVLLSISIQTRKFAMR